jgi:glutamate racemase
MDTMGHIGVFDSGMGGLRTLQSLAQAFPNRSYIYLADLAHAPYGARTHEEIYLLTKQAVETLREKGCSLIILACNTASSEALRRIQAEYSTLRESCRVLGILVPLAEAATQASQTHRIGVLATAATIAAGAYERELRKCTPDAQVTPVACPLLVPLIESGRTDTPACATALDEYCETVLRGNCDTIVLGCTHYGFLRAEIQKRLPSHVRIVDETDCIAQKVATYFEKHADFAAALSVNAFVDIYTTQESTDFTRVCTKLFGKVPTTI